jgi:hypothetical protein
MAWLRYREVEFIMAQDIVWETSFRNALELAKKTNKLVLAAFSIHAVRHAIE